MAARISIPRTQTLPAPPRSRSALLLLGAPVVAVLGGMSAEWLDFRTLRVPLLLMVGFGVLATAYALGGRARGWRAATRTVLVGVATWAGVQSVYSTIHVAGGERFHAGMFGPQWSQAIGLIAAHGLFLGAPTGIAAALMLWFAAKRGSGDDATQRDA